MCDMFMYYLFSLEYGDAVNFVNRLNESKSERRIHAAMYGVTLNHLEWRMWSISEVLCDKDIFENKKKYLCEELRNLKHMDNKELSLGLHFILTQNSYVCEVKTDRTAFHFDFNNSHIDIKKSRIGTVDMVLENIDARISSKFGDFSFTVSDILSLEVNEEFTLQQLLQHIADFVVRNIKRSPFKYISLKDNGFDIIRLFNVLCPEDKEMGWFFGYLMEWDNTGYTLSDEDIKHLERFMQHPNVLRYGDLDGEVLYMEDNSIPIAVLTMEKQGGTYKVSDQHSNVYKRWRLMHELTA